MYSFIDGFTLLLLQQQSNNSYVKISNSLEEAIKYNLNIFI